MTITVTSAVAGSSVVVISFLLTYIGVAFVRRWAERHLLDVPNERSSHVHPTPRGGGVVIVLVTIAGLVAAAVATQPPELRQIGGFVAGAIAIAAISWLDDVRSLPNRIRFVIHLAVAVLVIVTVGYWRVVVLPIVGPVDFGILGALITLIWIIGMINAYNFMDGIDGLAGGQAAVAALGWIVLGGFISNNFIVWAALLIMGSSLGFLLHNWAPARIFMGDVGSAFLGYSFAVLTIWANSQNTYMAVGGLLLVWPFLFDTIFTIIRRMRHGENVLIAHRSHLYQRLVIAGWSHSSVATLYIVLALIGSLVAVAWVSQAPYANLLVLAVPLPLSLALWQLVRMQEKQIKTSSSTHIETGM